MRMTLCIEQLQAEQVSLQFPPGVEEQSSGPINLPDLKLPLAIELGDVKIGRLLFNGSEELKGLQLAAHWTEKGLQIDSVHLQRDELSLNLSGLLQPSGNWPLTAEGKLTLPSPGTEPWSLALKVDGDLLKNPEPESRQQRLPERPTHRGAATAGGKPAGQSAHHRRRLQG
ncbi:hypothetical protein ACFS4T_23665 [Pseudomonas lini]